MSMPSQAGINARATTAPSQPEATPGLLPRAEWERHLHGYLRGFADGIEHGRRQMEDELATIQRTAADLVHRMAAIPPRDHEADRAAAARREVRWRR